MKIGFFTSIKGWGGSETYLLSLMKGVREVGHVPVLFGIEGARLWREAVAEGIECVAWRMIGSGEEDATRGRDTPHPNPLPHWNGHYTPHPSPLPQGERVQMARRGKAGWKNTVSLLVPGWVKLLAGNSCEALHLRRVFKTNPVDVMHVSSSGYEMAGLACQWCRIPSVVMNMITPPYEPYWFRRWLMRVTLRSYNHVSSQSKSCTDEWIHFASLPVSQCSFVWNGVDLVRFQSMERSRQAATAAFNLVTIGRLHPMKGYRYLIEAVGVLNDPRIHVDILGEGVEEGMLREIIAKLHLGGRVTLCGHVESPELYLRAADCFVLPSVSHESCPAVVPEAMACGLAVITSDFGPLPEVNVHGETGLVVPAGNVSALAEAIQNLMQNPDMCRRYGEAGKRRACEYFSRDRMVCEMMKIYNDIGGISARGGK